MFKTKSSRKRKILSSRDREQRRHKLRVPRGTLTMRIDCQVRQERNKIDVLVIGDGLCYYMVVG